LDPIDPKIEPALFDYGMWWFVWILIFFKYEPIQTNKNNSFRFYFLANSSKL